MVQVENRTDLAIKLAFGSDLALSGVTKLFPSLHDLLPLAPDHLTQTLALLAIAVGLTHTISALAVYINRARRTADPVPNFRRKKCHPPINRNLSRPRGKLRKAQATSSKAQNKRRLRRSAARRAD